MSRHYYQIKQPGMMRKFLIRLLERLLKINAAPLLMQEDINRLMRLVEVQMETELPNFKTMKDRFDFENNLPESFMHLRTIHEKLHKQ